MLKHSHSKRYFKFDQSWIWINPAKEVPWRKFTANPTTIAFSPTVITGWKFQRYCRLKVSTLLQVESFNVIKGWKFQRYYRLKVSILLQVESFNNITGWKFQRYCKTQPPASIRGALVLQIRSFFNIVQKAVDPPPPPPSFWTIFLMDFFKSA